MVKLRYMSDIHLEFLKKYPKFKCYDYINETLVLLGDIGYLNSKIYSDFIKHCSETWKNVILVYGNHEYFDTSIKIPMERVVKIDYPKNVYVLNNGTLYLDKITNTVVEEKNENCVKLIGTTLWSDVKVNISYLINDYKYIYTIDGRFSPFKTKSLFNKNKSFILEEIDEMPCVVLTQHATHELCNGKYTGSNTSSAYFTSIPELYESKNVIACINGHLHTNINTEANGVKILSNCMGYSNEKLVFDQKNTFLELT